MWDPPVVQIFISSPNRDVGSEREIAERVIARLDGIWKMHVRLHARRWEKSEYQAIKGFQEAIGEMAVYDVVIGILWKCIGSPLPPDLFRRPNGSAYESGTVFEIESAIAAGEKGGKPAVYILRKSEDVKFDARTVDEEKEQYARLLEWWGRTFHDEQGHNRRGYQWFKTTEEFEARLERLVENHLLERGLIPAGPAWDLDRKGSPYPGLISYAIEYAPVYCGRALTVRSAIEELKHAAEQEMPALFVVGPSGSGKSSLANAGLAPQFVGHGIEGVDFWRHVLIEPADDLLPLIARKLYEALPEIAAGPDGDVNGLCASLQESPGTAARTVKWALDRAGESLRDKTGGGTKQVGRLLLVLDQLETILKSPHRGKVSALARALIANEAAWVITTLRSDRYADLQQNEDFMAMRQRGALLDLPLPGPSEIDDIIKGPARAAQLIFEERDGASLAHVLRAAAGGPDALPLLQMTLTRLYDAREDRVLTFAAYKSMGGLEGAIAAYADEVFASLSAAAREKLDGLLRALVADIDDDGRLTICTPLRSAIAEDPASAELVETMTEARLLVSAGDSVRVAHEALLRRWQRAVDSPALQPDAIRLRRQLQPACDLWTRTRLDSDLLQAGTALAAAERVTQEHPGAFPPQLDTYIARSAAKANERAAAEKLKAQAEARRAKLRASIAFVMVAVLAAVSVAAFRLYQTANDNFVLALLAKADQLMIDERPTQADFVAEAIPRDLLSRVLAIGGASHQSEAEIRTRTIAAIAGPAAAAPLSTIMARSGATALAVSRDGNSFAAGFASGDIVVGSTAGEGSLRHLTGHSATINALAFSPTDATLVSASTDHSVRVWRKAAESPQVVCLASLVNAIDIDRAGNVALALEDGEVEIFNLAAPQEHRSFSQDHRAAYGVASSPDGSLLASSGKDDTIFIRRLADGALANRIATGHSDINSVSFSPDGKRIVAASVSGPVDVWDVFAPPRGTPIDAPVQKRWTARFSPDGKLVSIASWDGTVRLFDGDDYHYVGTIDGNDHWVNDAVFAHGSSRLITVGQSGTVRFWDTSSIRSMFLTIQDDPEETLRGRYSADGMQFVSGGRSGLARLYSVDEQGRLHFRCSVSHDGEVRSLAFSPDGRRIVSVGDREGVADNVVKLWSTSDCSAIRDFSTGPDQVYAVAYSPTGTHIAWAHRSGRIELMTMDGRWQPESLPNLHRNTVFKLDFSPDGRFLASAGRDNRVILWDVAQQKMARDLSGAHEQRVTTVRFSPDGRFVASGGPENHIFVWDLNRQDALIKILDVPGGSNELAFNRDGSILAVGSDARTISEWAVPSWTKIFQLNALVGVRSVFGFNPKLDDLAFDGENGLIRILPNHRTLAAPAKIAAKLEGLDVHFDQLPAMQEPSIKPADACLVADSSHSN